MLCGDVVTIIFELIIFLKILFLRDEVDVFHVGIETKLCGVNRKSDCLYYLWYSCRCQSSLLS